MPMNPPILNMVIMIFVFVFGACIGSFLNVVIWRMPRGLSIVYPPSHCPSCSKPIAWYDNLPLVSWLLLRGKCRNCRAAISPRYLVMEVLTGLLMLGLYAAYFVFFVRRLGVGPGDWIATSQLTFSQAWPMFIAHGALVCCLLACSMIDAKFFMIPLPVMWTAAVVGFAACVFRPHPMLATACSPVTVASALAAGIGLCVSIFAQHRGWILPSFIDAGGQPLGDAGSANPANPANLASNAVSTEKTVGFTSNDGINPRKEMLRELLFLSPAIVLAIAAAVVLQNCPSLQQWWLGLFNSAAHPVMGSRMACGGASVVGFMAGGLWIWATRILATLIFGREAMGLGDVHIMAGVGAVTGWVIPALAFFLAPVFGLALAIYMMVGKRGRELPYGPWLALGSLAAMLLYDGVVRFFAPGVSAIFGQ